MGFEVGDELTLQEMFIGCLADNLRENSPLFVLFKNCHFADRWRRVIMKLLKREYFYKKLERTSGTFELKGEFLSKSLLTTVAFPRPDSAQ